MHAQSGGDIEVMGLMLGKILGDTMVVTDAFRLPVEGTETRVNAQADGYEYMVEYMKLVKEAGISLVISTHTHIYTHIYIYIYKLLLIRST